MGNPTGGQSTSYAMNWGVAGVPRKTAVTFLGTKQGNAPWDARNSSSSIQDGMSTTVLITENVLGGASTGTQYSGGLPTNWATPHPNFVGFVASDPPGPALDSKPRVRRPLSLPPPPPSHVL